MKDLNISMRRYSRILAVIAALSLLASCAGIAENDPGMDGVETVITAIIDDGETGTRTCIDPAHYKDNVTGLLWSPGDKIGVFTDGTAAGTTGTENACFTNNSAGNVTKAKFTGSLAGTPAFAYYPYTEDNNGKPFTELTGTVHAEQTFSLSTGLLTDDWKYGVPDSGDAAEGYRFKMKHLFSMLKVNISADGTALEGQELESITLTLSGPDGTARRINGDFTFNAVDGSYTIGESATSSTTMIWSDKPQLSAGKTYTGYLTLIPDIKTGDCIEIEVLTGEYAATYRVKCKVDFQPGYIYGLPASLSGLAAKMAEDYGEEPNIRALPTLSSFKFTVADNAGKILGNQLVTSVSSNSYSPKFNSVTEEVATISGCDIDIVIPYLFDFKLIPQFTVAEGTTVSADGVAIESGKTEIDWSATKTIEVSANGDTRTYNVNVRNTGLPVVVVKQSSSGDFSKKYTGGITIGGSNIGGTLLNQFVDFMVRGKDTDWVEDDQMTVYNADGTVDMATTLCGVRMRGNSTQKLPKKPFAVKLTAKQKVLGMASHKRWCLMANWLDRSMIRNLVGFAAADATTKAWQAGGIDEGIIWNPSGRSVELVFDGHHVGNYLICEQIKIGSKRLNINDCYEDLVAAGASSAYEDCGYLVEFDVMQDETYKGVTSRGITWQLKDGVLPDDYVTKIGNKIQAIETSIKGGSYAEYSQLIDIPSFIDQWLIWELAMNREYTEPRSIYGYINGGNDKLHAGPVWDFDRGTFQNPAEAQKMGSDRVKSWDAFLSSSSKISKSGGYKENQQPCMWYPLLMDDADFVAAVQARWTVLKPYLEAVTSEIARLGQENALSWQYDSTMWPGTASDLNAGYPSGFSDFSGDENLTDYNAVIQNLIDCYLGRLSGMDALINAGSFRVSESTF
ncbi:MAG: CotH kinase family protein [Candidatus Cryptobacteroides sp.]